MTNRDWIEELRQGAEALIGGILQTQLDNLLGLHRAVRLSRFYDRAGAVARRDTYLALDEALADAEAGSDPNRVRSLAQLRELVGTVIEKKATASVFEARLETERTLTVDVDGLELPYRSLPLLIRRSADRERRRTYERALVEGAGQLTPLVAEELELAREAAASLGGEDYVAHRSRLMRFDVERLAEKAEDLLTGTDDMALIALSWLLRGRVEGAGRPRLSDLWFAMHVADLDGVLQMSHLEGVDDAFRSIGLDPRAGGRIVTHDEDRPTKSSRACCVPLQIPQQIHLVIPPTQGLPGYTSRLHELGHALHAAHTDEGLELEARRLGDGSVSEAYAVLFDHLPHNALWCRRVVGLSAEEADRVARTAAARSLLITRRHAAKLISEIALHRGSAEAAELYVELQRRALLAEPLSALHLVDVDPELYVSRYLRAWLFEGVAHVELRERFDEDWFRNPRAGSFLRRLFSEGQSRNLDQLVEEELGRPLELSALVSRYEEVLA